jgi:hypothetical protein
VGWRYLERAQATACSGYAGPNRTESFSRFYGYDQVQSYGRAYQRGVPLRVGGVVRGVEFLKAMFLSSPVSNQEAGNSSVLSSSLDAGTSSVAAASDKSQ